MRETDAETLFFFDAHPRALPLCLAFEDRLYAEFPQTQKRVQKTPITYFVRHVFACLSFARVRKRSDLPDPWIVITLGLPGALASERVASQTEVYRGRWTVHIVIGDVSEIDGELFSWVRAAYEFANAR